MSHGRLPEFSGNAAEWDVFAEQLSFYFVANGITDRNKQRAILLSTCGTTTYKLLKTLVAPAELSSKSVSELVELAQEHHNPKPSVIMCRFRFNTCVRLEGESITAYVTRLRDLASHCEYGDSAKELIRDRLVCGVRDDTLQRTLLAVAKLTFDKAYELALLHESAAQNTRLLQNPSSIVPVHFANPAASLTSDSQSGSNAIVAEGATWPRPAVLKTLCVIIAAKRGTFVTFVANSSDNCSYRALLLRQRSICRKIRISKRTNWTENFKRPPQTPAP